MKKITTYLLIFSMLFLVGCAKEENNINDEKEKTEVEMIKLSSGSSAALDIDGDGEQENVSFESVDMEDGFIANYIVKVNDKTFEEQVCGPHTYCYLVKMDTSKDEYTFVLGQDGPSDDYSSIFVRYKNDELVKYGEVGGVIDNTFMYSGGIEFNGDGTFVAPVRAEMVQTWFYNANYKIEKDKIVKEEKDFYDVNFDTELLVDFEFYKAPKDNAEKTLVRSQTNMKFIGIDDEKWTKVSYLDLYGEEAVAYFPVYFFCYMDEDMEVYDGDVFKDLCMAD